MTDDDKIASSCPVVGIGASAGGLYSLECFIGALPKEFNFAIVFVQHLSTRHKSLLHELLQKRRPDIAIIERPDGLAPLPGRIYLCPPGREIRIPKGTFRVTAPPAEGVRLPIDEFLISLAGEVGEKAAAVIFSGAGTDGSRGVRAIRDHGGTVFVQNPASAEFPSMPRAAIAAGQADGVLEPEEIAREILKLYSGQVQDSARDLIPLSQIEPFFRLIHEKTGHRFDHYKKSVISRRVRRRMLLNASPSVDDYLKMVSEKDSEAAALASDIMIGVTSFFRDRLVWKALRLDVIRKLAAEDDDGPFRVWTPACATGEEAYTIAMILSSDLGGKGREIQVFATDVNDRALEKAREGKYPASIAADVPSDFMRKYFTSSEDGASAVIKKEIRERVVFARQDLLGDPPFSRLDLIVCRNLLIYLEPDAQEKCIAIFHYALRSGRYLFLGNAESTGRKAALFKSVGHKKCRLYQKVDSGPPFSFRMPVPLAAERVAPSFSPAAGQRQEPLTEFVQGILLEEYAPAALAVDQNCDILYHKGPTNRYLQQPRGEPTRNLLALFPGNLKSRIRGGLYRADKDRKPVSLRVTIPADDGQKRQLTLRISRLKENIFLVVFHEKGAARRQTGDVSPDAASVEEGAVRQLESELTATRDALQGNIERLKSLNEELQSSNEELNAANEELETSREELQSLNEELITVNAQLQTTIEEQEETNNDLNNFLTSTNIPTIFLDYEFRVRRFTPAMSNLVKLIPSDVGRPLIDLSQEGLGPDIIADARAVLDHLSTIKKEIVFNGTWYIRAALPYRTADNRIEGVVVTYTNVTDLKEAEARTRHLASFPQLNPNPVIEVDASGGVTFANLAAMKILSNLGLDKGEVHVFLPDDLDDILRDLGGILGGREEKTFYREIDIKGRTFAASLHLVPQFDVVRIYARDITERKRAEEALRRSEANYHSLFDSSADGIFILDLDGNFIDANRTAYERLGYGREEFLSLTIRELDDPASAEQAPERFRQIREHGVAVFESAHLRKDGSMMPVEVNSRLFEYKGKQVFFSVVRDITERRKAEEIRGQLAAIVESADDAIIGKNLDGIIQTWNSGAEKMFGYAADEVIGKSVSILVPPGHADEVPVILERIRRGEHVENFESLRMRKDGSIVPVSLRFSPIKDANGRIIGASKIAHDITDRKRADEALLKAKQDQERHLAQLQTILDNLTEGLVVADLDANLFHWNPAAVAMHGFSSMEECRRRLPEFSDIFELSTAEEGILPVDRWPLTRILRGETLRDWEVVIRRQGSEWKRVFNYGGTLARDKDGNPLLAIVTVADITDRKRADEALRKLNEKLEGKIAERTRFYSMLARTGEAIARMRDRQSLFDEVCRICVEEGFFRLAWVGLLDPGSREVRCVSSHGERGYLDGVRIVADDVPEGKGPTGRAVYKGHYVINTDFEEDPGLLPWRDKARAHGLRSSSAFPLRTAEKVIGALTIYSDKPSFFTPEEVSLLLSLSEDISFALDSMETEKKRSEAEEDLRRLNEELEERVALRTAELEDANKELESFIYSVSHDLRAPLRSMSGFATFLEEDCGGQIDDRGKDYLSRIRNGAAKMNQLIEDLLNLSVITRGDVNKSAVDLSVLASSIISDLREADPGREVAVSLQQGLAAFADPRLMEIALANLLGNAWKFTSKEKDPRIEFGAAEKGGKTVYCVRDNGAGFDPEYAEKIFRPFQRLHSEEEFRGTGIGLAIVERIIRRHGGRIWAEAKKGRGATFYFTMG